MNWASVAKTEPKVEPQAAPVQEQDANQPSVVVVDANAIISGMRFDRMAESAVTIPEVLEEIRDKNSRQFLSTLPFGIDTRQPTEESLKAGS